MAIDYEDLKSDWVVCPRNTNVEFEIVSDPVKVQKVSTKDPENPKKYWQYDMKVKINPSGDTVKYGVFKSKLVEMTNELDKPDSLVGTKWRLTHLFVDDKDTFKLEYIKEFKSVDSSGDSPALSKPKLTSENIGIK